MQHCKELIISNIGRNDRTSTTSRNQSLVVYDPNKDLNTIDGKELEIKRDENNRCNPAQYMCPQSPSVSKRARRTTSETELQIM